ncbi:MAG: LysM peptidoglycan-binding domain-containing protein [Planctomycetes bacterium]|nr:LysM peptidoglycan-binding domain-containing protein [Planctomycetota bacterium]
MARETKVGLLAGLAFIICFAIILANRGRQDMLSQQLPVMADRGGGSRAPGMPGSGTPTAAPTHVPPRVDRELTVPGNTTSAPAAVPSGAAPADGGPATSAGGQPRYTDAAERVRLLEQKLNELTAGASTRPAPAPAAGSPTASEPAVTLTASPTASGTTARPAAIAPRRHTVTAGDTLSKIAAQHYGSRSNVYVNAIFDANHTLLPDRNALRVGMELVLPDLNDATSTTAADAEPPPPSPSTPEGKPALLPAKPGGKKGRASNAPAAPDPHPSTTSASNTPPTFRWYQVKKNDRYLSIAREQLGREDRWKEIYELNKDRFPQAGQIREGVRIKLPATRMAENRERRR